MCWAAGMRVTMQYRAPTLKLQVYSAGVLLWLSVGERENKGICKLTEHVSVAETTVSKI
jgi:hypothetical protein